VRDSASGKGAKTREYFVYLKFGQHISGANDPQSAVAAFIQRFFMPKILSWCALLPLFAGSRAHSLPFLRNPCMAAIKDETCVPMSTLYGNRKNTQISFNKKGAYDCVDNAIWSCGKTMERIAVFGAGTIGSCQATLVTGHGMPCVVVGHSAAGLERCRKAIAQNWDDLIANGLATEVNKTAAMNMLTITSDPAALTDCTFVFEAVSEDVDKKRAVYAAIEACAAPNAVIASCTSSIDAGILSKLTRRTDKLLIAHPFQPVHMLPLVEVVRHEDTSDETVQRTLSLLEALHRQVVVLNRSVPGFLVNRFAQALFRESIYLIEQGVTTAADIDKAIKYAVGMRYASIGLLEYFDAVGYELEAAIARNVYPDLCDTKEIQKLVREGIASGKTGQVAGEGLYDWSKKDSDDFRLRKQSPFFEGVRAWTMPE